MKPYFLIIEFNVCALRPLLRNSFIVSEFMHNPYIPFYQIQCIRYYDEVLGPFGVEIGRVKSMEIFKFFYMERSSLTRTIC